MMFDANAHMRAGGRFSAADAEPFTCPSKRSSRIVHLPGVEATRANVVCLSEVKPQQVEWLWPDRIPFRKITLLDGDPGLGKSTLTMSIAALVSTGQPMPLGSQRREAAGVVVVSLEDGLADTIRPRLEAAGADLLRVYALTGIGPELRTPTLPDDLPEIERVVREHRARLVIFDPLMGVLGEGIDAHKDQHVRRALAPVAAFAERTGAAVVVVRHLNKSGGAQAIYRGGGSIGITGAARSVMLVAKDPDNPEGRVLASVKSNLGQQPKALRFGLVVSPLNGYPLVGWAGTCGLTADELVAPPENEGRENAEARRTAEQFLRTELASGPRRAAEIQASARAEGLCKTTLWRAKAALHVDVRKVGFRSGWFWCLPGSGTTYPAEVNSSANPCPASEGDPEEFTNMDSSAANLEEFTGMNASGAPDPEPSREMNSSTFGTEEFTSMDSSADALENTRSSGEEFTSGGTVVELGRSDDEGEVYA